MVTQAFEYQETVFYAIIWLAACFTGMVRAARENEHRSLWDLLVIGLASGFFGFAFVAFAYHYLGSNGNDEWFFVAMAVILGFLGKEQDAILAKVFNKILDKMGLADDEKEPK